MAASAEPAGGSEGPSSLPCLSL